jgi:adenosylhomocysteine nucleosidase
MESAAVGQVCHNYSIPFMIIRSISDDTTQDDNKETYDQLLVKASAKAGELVFNLISHK